MAVTILFDFASDIVPCFAVSQARSARASVAIRRFRAPPNPGVRFAAAQFALLMHESAPVELCCRLPESDREERRRVSAGQFHLMPAAAPVDARWTDAKQSLVIAFEQDFIERAIGEAFDGRIPEMRCRFGLSDPAIEALAVYLRFEMTRNSPYSRLYLEHVGASLAVRLFESYGDGAAKPSSLNKGGLTGLRQKRVCDFIEAHLGENISLAALATEAGLSAHHFGKAFKESFGIAPCRYVANRRIHRAKELLLSDHQSITEIAYALGFCSHSHLSEAFRKATGVTPSDFRKRRD
jgi:AraC family transcriptional regulator